MADQLSLRGGTTSEHATFTGANKEVTVDTTKKTLVVNDGATVGGHPLMRENASNSALALGSAATPSLKFTGDTNTGIYSPGADQVAISTNGTGRLFIDASGRILAGTASSSVGGSGSIVLQGSAGPGVVRAAFGGTSPGSTDILGAITFTDSSHTGAAYIYGSRDGGTWTSITSQPSAITFGTTPNGSGTAFERLRITSSGLVGIGVSAPAGALNVASAAVGNPSLTYNTSNIVNLNYGAIQLALGINDAAPYGGFLQARDNANGSRVISLNPAGGNVGIGTTSPGATLDVSSATGTRIRSSYTNTTSARDAGFEIYGDVSGVFASRASLTYAGNSGLTSLSSVSDLVISTNSLERARIDSSGRLLVGTSTASVFTSGGITPRLQVEGTDGSTGALSIARNSNDANGAGLIISKSRGTTAGSNTIVSNNDTIASIRFEAGDGTQKAIAGSISCEVDNTPGANDMPGRLVFSTTADGAASPTERFRITNDGVIAHDQQAPATYAAAATLTVADLKTGIITYTGTAATLTLPTGTLTEGGFSGIYTNMAFEWSVINTGAGICTIGAGTAHTIVGSATVAIGASARFTSRRTAANTFVSYRLA